MEDNGPGLRGVVRSLTNRFLPPVPFAADMPHKGVWERFTKAQNHVWRRYMVKGEVSGSLTCVVLSDLHTGSHAGDLERLDGIMREIDGRSCHLLLLPGDFVNMQVFGGGRIRPEATAEVLSTLARRIPAVAVLGNHDSEYGTRHVASALEHNGIQVLFNDWRAIETTAGLIHVAGLEDHSTGQPDVVRALGGIPRLGTTLVLAHDPASFAAIPSGPIATVCGHTHGGQICLPWFGPLVNASDAPLSCTHGHITDGGRNLIVSAGLGTSGLPLRANCPPELVELIIEPR